MFWWRGISSHQELQVDLPYYSGVQGYKEWQLLAAQAISASCRTRFLASLATGAVDHCPSFSPGTFRGHLISLAAWSLWMRLKTSRNCCLNFRMDGWRHEISRNPIYPSAKHHKLPPPWLISPTVGNPHETTTKHREVSYNPCPQTPKKLSLVSAFLNG